MTILDSSLAARAAGLYGHWEQRWKHPRLLALLFVLALGGSVIAALGGGLAGAGSWKSGALFGAGTESLGAFGTPGANWERAKSCGQIHQIVERACALKQYDHDVDGIHQCIAHELKYTMWSAYDCS